MRVISADYQFLRQGVTKCVVIEDQETPRAVDILDFADRNEATTFTGLCLVCFPLSTPCQVILNPTQLDRIFTNA